MLSSLQRRLVRRTAIIGGAGLLLVLLVVLLRARPAPAAAADLTQASFLALAVLAFLGGVLSFALPCTLPLLPAYFAVTSQSDRKRILATTLAFQGGLALTFGLFGALAGIAGLALSGLGLTRFELARLGGLVVIMFGVMSLLGRGFTGFRAGSQRSASLWGAFVFGATFGLGWTSCIGPVLGSITTVAISANMDLLGGQYGGLAPLLSSALLLVIFALGLGLPLIIVSAFFGRADRNSLFWRILRGKGWEVKLPGRTRTRALFLHSTSIVSGLLFIGLGALMVAGRLALLDNLAPENLALNIAEVTAGIEDWLIARLGG